MNFTLNEIPEHIAKLLDYARQGKDDVTLFAFHQANKLILASLATCLHVPLSKVPFASEKIGNTSSASIPLLLTEQYAQQDEERPLQNFFCCGFGVGLSAASALLDLSTTNICRTVEL